MAIKIKKIYFNLKGFADVTSFLTYSLVALGLLAVRYIHDDQNCESDSSLESINVTESSFVDTSNRIYSEECQSLNETQKLLSNEYVQSICNTNATLSKFSFFEKLKEKCQKKLFFQNKSNCLFLIIYIYFSNITFFGLLNEFTSIKYVLLGFFALNNVLATVLLSIFKQTKINPSVIFRVIFSFSLLNLNSISKQN